MFDRYSLFWYFCLVIDISFIVSVVTALYLLYSNHKKHKSIEKVEEKCYNNTNEDIDVGGVYHESTSSSQ